LLAELSLPCGKQPEKNPEMYNNDRTTFVDGKFISRFSKAYMDRIMNKSSISSMHWLILTKWSYPFSPHSTNNI